MGSTERWIFFQVVLHEENDGATFLRHGAEAVERVITPDEAESRFPEKYKNAVRQLAEKAGFIIQSS